MTGGLWGAIKVIGFLFTLFYRPKAKSSMEDPKPGELSVQTSTRGMPIPKVYGQRKVSGNLIWYDNFQVHRHYDEVKSGKGGGGKKKKVFSHYSYSVSFAFAVCIGPMSVLKIWKGKDEIPKPAGKPDWEDSGIFVYKGEATQTPDAHIASFVPRSPAYRNVCYIVFRDFNLGRSSFLPNFSFEVGTLQYSGIPITNCVELQAMQNNLSANYYLANDIDCTYCTQDPGGALYNGGAGFIPVGTFSGTLDGHNHIIKGLKINRPSTQRVGLFGKTAGGATIKNLGLVDGVVNGSYRTGGLIGLSYGVSVTNCYFSGSIVATGEYHGGLIGEAGSGNHSLTKCYSAGSISGGNYTGGLVGMFNPSSAIVTNCYSTISVSAGNRVGGFIGFQYVAIVTNCYSTGSVSGGSNTGGFMGQRLSGSAIDCFWDTETSGQAGSAGGIGKTTAEMKQQATFTNWDFNTIWNITEAITYPWLKYVAHAPPDVVVADLPPPQISQDMLTNDLYGLGLSGSKLNSAEFAETEQYCIDEDMLITAVIDGEISATDLLQNICAHHNGYMVYSGGIAHKQIKTETIVNTVDVDTDVLSKKPPVEIDRDAFRDICNRIRVKYTKRADLYSAGIEKADDEVHQVDHGLKDRDVTLAGYTTAARAAKIAYTILRRSLRVPMLFSFTVGPKKAEELIPGSVFALTDNQQGLTNMPMRVLSAYEAKDNKIEIKAIEEIDFVLDVKDGASSETWNPPLHGGDPGNVRHPLVAELPPIMSGDTNLAAISFSDSGEENWSGATIYDSFDDTTYESKESTYGAGLTGIVDSVTAEKVTVTITDEEITLQSVADVFELLESLNTNLCWVKESNTYFRFAKATLIAPGQWELEGMIWNVFKAPVLMHNISAGQAISFIRYKQEPITIAYDIDRRGSSIYYKIVSFNFFGEYEDISLITPEQITFKSIGSRPIAPQNLEITGKGNITKVGSGDIPLRWRSCNRLTRGLDYERSDQIQEDTDFIRFDIVVKSGVTTLRSVSETGTTWTYTAAMQAADGSPSAITFEITKICNKNKSFKSTLNITIV
ncbi:MAG: hypothetical protein KAX15_02685 [Candidatus Omnitrophica bacterium]|nr:hypothetical protein [Candidatus Omnitrophota bacterium]